MFGLDFCLSPANNNDSGVGSLRWALESANSNQGLDHIKIESDVTLTSALNITDDVNIYSLMGSTITQTGEDRIFNIDDGDAGNDLTVSLDNLNFTGGSPDNTGGAILSYEALTIANSSFYDNVTTLRGGAVYQENGSLSVTDSRFISNKINFTPGIPTSAGGAIYAKNTTLSVVGGLVEGNQSKVGAIAANNTDATVNGTQFEYNLAGGIFAFSDTNIEVYNSVFNGNRNDVSGGGIAVQNDSTAIIADSTFTGNYADYGGAVQVLNSSEVSINNSTMTGNSADLSGGAIDIYDNSTLEMVDSTITGNSANFGGGIASEDGTSQITLIDTVVTNNAVDNLAGDGFIIVTTPEPETPIVEDEHLVGTGDDDLLTGGVGNDILEGKAGDNILEGKAGDDILEANAGNDTLFGGVGNDILIAGQGEDVLYGGAGDDKLAGNLGNDTLLGGFGNDKLMAKEGDDILNGGEGDDTLKGGDGADKFVINSNGVDRILDFELGTDSLFLAKGLSFDNLDLVGDDNAVLEYEGERIGVVMGITPTELANELF